MDDIADAPREDDDLPAEHDPEAHRATTGIFRDPLLRAYAFCRGGFVRAVRTAFASEPHPFGDAEMSHQGFEQDPRRDHVIDVTGAEVHPGYIVDNKGNVSPSVADGRPLRVDEPAYLARNAVAAVPITEHAEIVGRPGVDGTPEAPPSTQTDAKIEARDENDSADLPDGHERDHGVQEHHDHPVHEAGDDRHEG